MTRLIVQFILITVMLSGCMRDTRSETFIIPDSEDEQSLRDENEQFAVKTIYRVLEKNEDNVNTLGWIDRQSIVGLLGEQSRFPSYERIDFPYDSRLKLRDAGELSGFSKLSPDGRTLLTIDKEDHSYPLKLVSLSDQGEKVIGNIELENIRSIRLGWSNNSRFLIYFSSGAENSIVSIHVYDTVSGQTKSYSVPEWQEREAIVGVHIADDGQSAAIIKETSEQTYVVFGNWRDGEFVNQFEHSVSPDGWVEWIHEDQVAFAGPDGSLYAYDRRNAELSVLLQQIGVFRLSQDRKYIAYTQDSNTVYAAVLYGNNIINKKRLYRGIIPSHLAWSPDNGKLLISGWKSYPRTAQSAPAVDPGPAVVGLDVNQSLVIEFE